MNGMRGPWPGSERPRYRVEARLRGCRKRTRAGGEAREAVVASLGGALGTADVAFEALGGCPGGAP